MIRFLERLLFPLFILTLIVSLAYWYWTTTPSYALSQILAAVKNKDTETFEKYVDIETISDRAIDNLLHGPAKDSGLFNISDSMLGIGIIGFFKPEIAEIARSQILKYISQGSLSKKLANSNSNPHISSFPLASTPAQNPKSNSSFQFEINKKLPSSKTDNNDAGDYAQKYRIQGQLKDYGISKEGFKGIDYLRIEGPISFVGLKFTSKKLNRDFIIELKMEDTGGYWRITELSNLNDLINTYLETRDEFGSFYLNSPYFNHSA